MAIDMLISTLRQQYIASELTPLQLLDVIEARLAAAGDDAVWISRIPSAGLRDTASALERRAAREGVASMPLYGIPFAVKDNIDAAGLPTTAACPAFAYTPERSAAAVERLLAAGALLIGKTNLDQFATGLVGTRSPYGVPRNPFNADYIPGGRARRGLAWPPRLLRRRRASLSECRARSTCASATRRARTFSRKRWLASSGLAAARSRSTMHPSQPPPSCSTAAPCWQSVPPRSARFLPTMPMRCIR